MIEIVELIIFGIFILSGFIAIGMIFYIGKTRVKEIDRAVLGYEYPNDSIFALLLRVPNYAGGFLWKWSARRTGLEGKIEHFDKKFRRPFIASFLLMILSMVCLIVGSILQYYAN